MATNQVMEEDKRSRRPVGRPSQRAEILDAAVESFAQGGTRGTTLARIAGRVGVTGPAIIHHFGTKENLLREVVARSDVLSQSVFVVPDGSTALVQVSAMRQWASRLVSDPSLANLTQLSAIMAAEALGRDSPFHDEFMQRHETFRCKVADQIKMGMDDGSIRPGVDARNVATELIAFMQGVQLQWFLEPDRVDLVGVFEAYFDRLVVELSAGPSTERPTKAKGLGRSDKRNATSRYS
jgi:AcrR family transcriptional regulator